VFVEASLAPASTRTKTGPFHRSGSFSMPRALRLTGSTPAFGPVRAVPARSVWAIDGGTRIRWLDTNARIVRSGLCFVTRSTIGSFNAPNANIEDGLATASRDQEEGPTAGPAAGLATYIQFLMPHRTDNVWWSCIARHAARLYSSALERRRLPKNNMAGACAISHSAGCACPAPASRSGSPQRSPAARPTAVSSPA
jgi:hypothetical protein